MMRRSLWVALALGAGCPAPVPIDAPTAILADGSPAAKPDGGAPPAVDAAPGTADGPTPVVGTGHSMSQLVGPQGGTIVFEALTLTFPPGALAKDEMIGVTSSPNPPPAGYVTLSPIYDFIPNGLTFMTPATLAIGFTGDPATAGLFYTDPASLADFTELDDTVSGQVASALVQHFSGGGVMVLCPPGQKSCPPKGQCRNLQTDRSNCGECGKLCPVGTPCLNGYCGGNCNPACDSGEVCCDGPHVLRGTCLDGNHFRRCPDGSCAGDGITDVSLIQCCQFPACSPGGQMQPPHYGTCLQSEICCSTPTVNFPCGGCGNATFGCY
jgi:hypothetical protein